MKISLKYFSQLKKYSCGPVSLRMVFEHLGITYSEMKLIKLCKSIPKKGTENEAMIHEIQKEGLEYIEKYNAKIVDILNALDSGYPPVVNYINPLSSGGHYAVVTGYSHQKKILYFADPANGNDFTLSFKKFSKLWHDSASRTKGWFVIIGREKISVEI